MTTNLLIHSPFSINCNKFVNQFLQRQRHYRHYNHILIPYFCKNINHNSAIITGNFVWPIWNTLERTILSRGCEFHHTYICGRDFLIEYQPESLSKYYITGKNTLSNNSILVNDLVLKPNSILLFPIDRNVAKPFIDNHLL